MTWEGIGLLLVLIGLIALPYAMLYSYARDNDARRIPEQTIPFDPFSIFSLHPLWRKCMRCHRYDYSTDTRCHNHAIPAPLLPLTQKIRYRVQRMSEVCLFVGNIEQQEREAFERFALTLMAAQPGMIWTPPEVVGLYHLDACVSIDSEGGGEEYAII